MKRVTMRANFSLLVIGYRFIDEQYLSGVKSYSVNFSFQIKLWTMYKQRLLNFTYKLCYCGAAIWFRGIGQLFSVNNATV